MLNRWEYAKFIAKCNIETILNCETHCWFFSHINDEHFWCNKHLRISFSKHVARVKVYLCAHVVEDVTRWDIHFIDFAYSNFLSTNSVNIDPTGWSRKIPLNCSALLMSIIASLDCWVFIDYEQTYQHMNRRVRCNLFRQFFLLDEHSHLKGWHEKDIIGIRSDVLIFLLVTETNGLRYEVW